MLPAARLSRLIDSYLYTQLIVIAVRLNIPEFLAGGARTSTGLADALGIDAGKLRRVLRGLASIEVLEELDGDRFALTELGELLRRDVPGSLVGPALLRGELNFPAAAQLLASLTGGGIPFERAFGTDLFSFLQQSNEANKIFQASMTARSRIEAEAVARVHDFSASEIIVDIGGGSGALLEAVLRAAPESRGILFDLPEVAEMARRRFDEANLARRVEIVEGNFFDGVTPGGDLYLLSRIIHDWDDEQAGVILGNVRRAIRPSGTLMLIEAVSPERAIDQPAIVSMDLHMLLMLSGRERMEAEFDRLLRETGFELLQVVDLATPTGTSLIEARAI
jgi:ubiquinone/menaquinone biosynthesis C-methylase UbiE